MPGTDGLPRRGIVARRKVVLYENGARLPAPSEIKSAAREALRVHPDWLLSEAVRHGYEVAFGDNNPGAGRWFGWL